MCICRCYHKRIDHHILRCNASESRIWCKYYRVNQANNRSENTNNNEIPSKLGNLQLICLFICSFAFYYYSLFCCCRFKYNKCAFLFPQLREIGVAVGGGAIVFAVTTLLCVKFVTIIASSIVGSTMIMSAIDFFMHRSDTIQWVCFPFQFQLMRAQFLYAIYLRFFS